MDPSTESIIRKLQANFKDATSQASRQIIGEELCRFLKGGCGTEEEEISHLEDAIRNRLAGRSGTSGRTEKLAAKKSQFSQDEWGKITLYMAFMAREDEKRRVAQEKAHKRQVHNMLAGQVAEAQQRKLAEKEAKKEEVKTLEAELQQWEQDQKQQQQRRQQEMQVLRGDREMQLEQQANRRQVAAELKKRAEQELGTRIALDVKLRMEAEAAAKAKAKADLKEFLQSNEINKKIKAKQEEQERQQDLRYMQQAAAQLDKQEADREKLLERVRAVQNRQAQDAAHRPPVKRWVAEEVVERQFQEKQAALDADEARRKAQVAAAAAKFRADICGQMVEKEAARLAELQEKRKELVGLMADLELCKKTSAEAKAAELAKMRAFKLELEAQIADNQARRAVSSMSDVERKLNARLLKAAEEARCGTIPAARPS